MKTAKSVNAVQIQTVENHHLLLHNKYIWLSYIGKKKRNIVGTCNEISYDTTSQLVLVPIIQKWVTGGCSIDLYGGCVFLWNCKLPLTIRNTREEGSVRACVCVCVCGRIHCIALVGQLGQPCYNMPLISYVMVIVNLLYVRIIPGVWSRRGLAGRGPSESWFTGELGPRWPHGFHWSWELVHTYYGGKRINT